jgi:type I restriction enzyme S subunit
VNLPPEAREGVRTQLKPRDVLISVTADIGMIGYVDEHVTSPAFINQHIALVRLRTSGVDAKFVAYHLASDDSQSRFRASTDNGTKAGMNLMAIQNMPLNLPAVAEQERIAACLSSLDALVAAQSKKLDGLRAYKKGLVQQLFPSQEGV